MSRQRFVLLDRDGTVIVERNYLTDPSEVELLPGVCEGLRRLRGCGWGLAIITNQSAIGRGMMDEERLAKVHQRMCALLAEAGIDLDGIFYCPHLPSDECKCRKPKSGLVMRAAIELKFLPSECVVVGDKPCDIEVGNRVGATTLLVRTGYGSQFPETGLVQPDLFADDLLVAADLIVSLSLKEHSATSTSIESPCDRKSK